MPNTSKRGFASMDNDKQRLIASKGGRAAHAKGTAHEWTKEEARAAGRKGGESRGTRHHSTTLEGSLQSSLHASATMQASTTMQASATMLATSGYASNFLNGAGSLLRRDVTNIVGDTPGTQNEVQRNYQNS
ncbi:MAG TPA: KGG domain-containing protein [Candidatus Kapabacteria bacterium]|jgi:hypothetical protein|nr:KGG domain-containing protein [Candidatus Kapabacteria bacterium]